MGKEADEAESAVKDFGFSDSKPDPFRTLPSGSTKALYGNKTRAR